MISIGLQKAPRRNLRAPEAAFCLVPLIIGKERRGIDPLGAGSTLRRGQSAIALVGRPRDAGMGGAQRR